MKNFKKVTAAIAATLMVATMTAPMAMNSFAASVTEGGNTITISGSSDSATHAYSAYQIFTGTYDTANGLTVTAWGDGVNGEAIVTALKADITISNYFTNVSTAAQVAEVLANTKTGEAGNETKVFTDDSAETMAFVDIVAANLTSTTSGTSNGDTISGLPDGYYIVKDVTQDLTSGARSYHMVKTVGGSNVTMTVKNAAPTVDKQVKDETNDAETGSTDGWGETADHAINESYQYKLTATLTQDADYAKYDTYRVTFTDTLGAGVTFESIESVKVNNTAVDVYNKDSKPNGYYSTATEGATDTEWSLSIADIKEYVGDAWADTANVTVEVIYNAHLNENATIATETATGTENGGVAYAKSQANLNDVKLSYSNNPNWKYTGKGGPHSNPGDNDEEDKDEEKGETPKDTVGVFTYDVKNTKIDGVSNQPLAGVEFKLYSDSDCKIEIGLIFDSTLGAYRPVKGTEEATAMTSATDTGEFNIKGLDAGTYYLKETQALDGYNELANPIEIKITATHAEVTKESDNVSITLTKSGANNTGESAIKNQKGTELPSTGGIGTKLFYLGGGTMVAVAGIFLITKKRMKKDEA